MDSKTAYFLTKLVIEDDDDDVVRFAFSNEKRKVKCSVSMLTEVSPVFEAMFSGRWTEQKSLKPLDEVTTDQEKTIKLDDDVKFDQYLTFKLFVQCLYGLLQIDSLTVDQATAVYFYAHKYQVKDVEDKIQKFLNGRMESGISKKPLSVRELEDGVEFANIYQLDEFKKKLEEVKLAFDEENPMKFFVLANKYDLNGLKRQVIDHLKTIAPKEDWVTEALHSVIKSLQEDREEIKHKLKATKLVCNCSRYKF